MDAEKKRKIESGKEKVIITNTNKNKIYYLSIIRNNLHTILYKVWQ